MKLHDRAGVRRIRLLRWLVPLAVAVGLLGCFDSAILVKVNKDGSGTVEETVVLSNTFTEMMKSFGGGTAEEGAPEQEQNLVDEEKLRAKAASMGPGVELVSAEPVTTDSGSGFRAVYRFQDINNLKVNQNPSENVPGPPTGGDAPQNPEELLQFRFSRGSTATLEIIYPQQFDEPDEEGAEAQEGPDPSADPEMMAMMKELYKDMRMRLAVQVNGSIVDTNATYRDGSQVTLMDVDFGKLMEEGDAFDRLMRAKPNTVEEMKELLKGIESIKVETAQEIRIRFR
jgi:hypothetical protein